ncbi:MAG: PaaI family thioesterase [Elusimicrobia bacterium]|nr:PaaI family thioesterase [Elusimicrobiota bacterium]MDE2509729.1 PaaI family thioesterase [Elusimicrobiota bacterium]
MARWPEADWTPVQPFPFAEARGAFAGMTSSEGRIVLHYYRRPDGGLAATAEFGPLSEGAPGLVHGGAILTALDETLGAAAWLAGRRCMTARLTTEFRKGVPLESRLLVVTRIVASRRRLIDLAGELTGEDGTVYAAAHGRFMELDDAQQRRIFGRAASKSPEKS